MTPQQALAASPYAFRAKVADTVSAPLTIAGPRFVDNGNGTVTDNQTGLMWEQKL